LRNSIVQHTTLAFILVIGVTLCSMLGGMYMADSIQGDAEALNKAGSLRMQSYRLTLLALENEEQLLQEHIAKFEQTLLDYSLARAIGNDPASTLHRLYGKAVERWHDSMLPLLQNQPRQIRAFRAEVPVFVNELDQFVHALQVKSEGKLAVIRGLQIGTLLFTVLMAFFVLLGVYSNLITPLRELTRLAQQIGRGDFRSKAYYEARNELGLLARAFNKMSDELADLYDHLERKVDEKTAQLQRSNNSLELLFNSARSLYRSSADPIPEPAAAGPALAGFGAGVVVPQPRLAEDLFQRPYGSQCGASATPLLQASRLRAVPGSRRRRQARRRHRTDQLRPALGQQRIGHAARGAAARGATGALAGTVAQRGGGALRRLPRAESAGPATGAPGADGRARCHRPGAA